MICPLTHQLYICVLLNFYIFGVECVFPVTFILLINITTLWSESIIMCDFNSMELVETSSMVWYVVNFINVPYFPEKNMHLAVVRCSNLYICPSVKFVKIQMLYILSGFFFLDCS